MKENVHRISQHLQSRQNKQKKVNIRNFILSLKLTEKDRLQHVVPFMDPITRGKGCEKVFLLINAFRPISSLSKLQRKTRTICQIWLRTRKKRNNNGDSYSFSFGNNAAGLQWKEWKNLRKCCEKRKALSVLTFITVGRKNLSVEVAPPLTALMELCLKSFAFSKSRA